MRAPSLRGLVLSSCSGLALCACSADVLLGAECPDFERRCEQTSSDVDAGGRNAPDAATDAARVDASRPGREDARSPNPERDSGPPPDPNPDSGIMIRDEPNALIDRLDNLSFELAPGSEPGDVALLMVAPTQTSITPWSTCQFFGTSTDTPLAIVRAEREVTTPYATLQPAEGTTFVSLQSFIGIIPLPVGQTLTTPLPAGTRVRFAIDVCSSDTSAQLSLQVWGGDDLCFAPASARRLLATKVVRGTTWQPLCVEFTTPVEMKVLAFVPDPESAFNDHRLYLDNLRSTDECPSE